MNKSKKVDSFNKATSILALSILLGTITYAWTGPTQSAPNGNVPAPINVGSILQEKIGGIRILGDSFIGTSSSPYSSFTIHGKAYSEQITDGDGDATLVTKGYVDGKSGQSPTGMVSYFNLSECPDGWVIADGLNGTPDLRGEFIRGLDNGRGIDSGRILSSWQESTGVAERATANNGVIYIPISNSDGTFGSYSFLNGGVGGGSGSVPYQRFRPRNVALLACVKE